MKTNPNDSAFAHVKYDESNTPFVDSNMTGLTKREYFAAIAMQGIAPMFTDRGANDAGTAAKHAVEMAGALITELNKATGEKEEAKSAPLMLSEMQRYLPVLEWVESMPEIWQRAIKGTGIATLNGYRNAIEKATGESLTNQTDKS